MISNKNVNRMLLGIVLIYLGGSFLAGFLQHFVRFSVSGALLFSQGLILVPTLLYCLIKKVSVKELIPFRKMRFSVWILVIVCTYLMYPLLIVLNALTLFFVKSGTADVVAGMASGNFFIAALLMAVLPAFNEEFLFRGLIFGTYKRSKMLPAILLSGFLFGCMHMNFNQFLYAFVLGIYLAFLVEATGGILSAMLGHFVLNFTAAVMSFGLPKIQEALGQVEGGANLESQAALQAGSFLSGMDAGALALLVIGVLIWAFIAIGTTAGAVGIYIAICKLSGRWEHVKTMFRQGTKERLVTVPVVIAMVIMVGMMLFEVFG